MNAMVSAKHMQIIRVFRNTTGDSFRDNALVHCFPGQTHVCTHTEHLNVLH